MYESENVTFAFFIVVVTRVDSDNPCVEKDWKRHVDMMKGTHNVIR